MPKLKENFLKENKGKTVELILANGFHLRGLLVDYDEEVMSIKTNQYQDNGKPVLVSYGTVSTYVPIASF